MYEKFRDEDSLEEFKKSCRLYRFDKNKVIGRFIEKEEVRKMKNVLDHLKDKEK